MNFDALTNDVARVCSADVQENLACCEPQQAVATLDDADVQPFTGKRKTSATMPSPKKSNAADCPDVPDAPLSVAPAVSDTLAAPVAPAMSPPKATAPTGVPAARAAPLVKKPLIKKPLGRRLQFARTKEPLGLRFARTNPLAASSLVSPVANAPPIVSPSTQDAAAAPETPVAATPAAAPTPANTTPTLPCASQSPVALPAAHDDQQFLRGIFGAVVKSRALSRRAPESVRKYKQILKYQSVDGSDLLNFAKGILSELDWFAVLRHLTAQFEADDIKRFLQLHFVDPHQLGDTLFFRYGNTRPKQVRAVRKACTCQACTWLADDCTVVCE